MTTVAIIGAGQLGSRHLQALNLIDKTLNIKVFDPYEASLSTAKSRFEASIGNIKHQISYSKDLNFDEAIDIAIVATTAKARRKIIEDLLTQSKVRHLVLEKLLFTNYHEYHDMAEFLSKYPTKVWVNCCMRMMPFYVDLESKFQNQAIQYRVSGSLYGLVTNAIHYLDHVAALTGCYDFVLDTTYLDKQLIKSKREGYFELTGLLLAEFSNGSLAMIHSANSGTAPVQVEIYDANHRIISRESEHKAWISSASEDWLWQERAAPIPFQSSLTADLLTSLETKDSSELPNYEQSMHIHLQLLEPLKKFLWSLGIEKEEDYPFT